MNNQSIQIEFKTAEGALLRLIGLVERRGFDVRSMALATGNNERMKLDLGLNPRQSMNDIGILKRQIHRLNGVCTVQDSTISTPKGTHHGR
jgi:acetolactate synthase regulatory subunit